MNIEVAVGRNNMAPRDSTYKFPSDSTLEHSLDRYVPTEYIIHENRRGKNSIPDFVILSVVKGKGACNVMKRWHESGQDPPGSGGPRMPTRVKLKPKHAWILWI